MPLLLVTILFLGGDVDWVAVSKELSGVDAQQLKALSALNGAG